MQDQRTSPRSWLLACILTGAVGMAGCGGSAEGMEALTAEEEPIASGDSTSTPASMPTAPAPAELQGPPPEPESPVKPFIGTYKYVGGVAEQRVLWGRIESIASSFNFFAKGIVRDRLAAGNQIAKEIKISADSDTLMIQTGSKNTNAAPMDGTAVPVKVSSGEMMDLSYAVSTAEIEQNFKGKGRGRVNRYELQGDKLILHVKIYAGQLPKELVYDLTYERVGAGDAPSTETPAKTE